MSCNCNCGGNSCGVPKQPNYNNLNKGFIEPKKGCCDCCNDEDNICRNGKIIIIDKNHLYPDEGIYLEDKTDGNQILHITLLPNDYAYVVDIDNSFYVTHIFITYKDDNVNNCNNIYKLYINNKSNNIVEIKINNDLEILNDFFIRELDEFINDSTKYKYLNGKFFQLSENGNVEIEVIKPANTIKLYCDDIRFNNSLKILTYYFIDSSNIKQDSNGDTYHDIILKLNEFPTIICNDTLDYVNININANVESLPLNYEYKFCIYVNDPNITYDIGISIWNNDTPPDLLDGYLYEISICQIARGIWSGCWAKYTY